MAALSWAAGATHELQVSAMACSGTHGSVRLWSHNPSATSDSRAGSDADTPVSVRTSYGCEGREWDRRNVES
jgi:hypothetical protein